MMYAVTLPLVHFQIPLQVIVLGAITGTAYALFGMGLTLTYQSARVVNFAQGAMGAMPSLFVAAMVVDHGMGYWLALFLALAMSVATGALMEYGIIRRLTRAPRLVVLVATIAVAELLLIPGGFMVNLNHTKLGSAPYPVPFHTSIKAAGVQLGGAQILILVIAPVLVGALTVFLRRTPIGMASRGMAENSEAAELAGIPIHRVSLTVWAIAGLLAGIAGVLVGPNSPPLADIFSTGGSGAISSDSDLLLRGLGAAMMGGLASLPQVFAAGIGIGVLEALVRWNYPTGGAVQLVIVAVILGSLLMRRDLRQLARGGEESSWSLSGAVRALPDRIRSLPKVRAAHRGMLAVFLGLAALAPLVAHPSQRVLLSAVALYIIVSLSLVILTGWAGQVSLGHFSFVALGALVGGRMAQLGYPTYGELLFACAAGAAAALLVGLPALRLRGLFLAVSTLAFAVLVDGWLTQQKWLVNSNGSGGSMTIHRPDSNGFNLNNELTLYYLILAFTVAAALVVHRLRNTGWGRRFIAVRDNEAMAAALSVSPAATKLTAFVLSGAIASFAGYFYGMLLVNFGGAGLTNPTISLTIMTMVIVGGSTSITGAVLGALYMRGLPYFVHSTTIILLTSGGGLILVLLLFPGGLASLAFRVRDWVVERLAGPGSLGRPATQAAGPVKLEPRPRRELPADAPPDLEVRDVRVHFGGVKAVDGVSMEVRHGEIVGLIGPNGAGKTTLFDILSGLTTPDHGRVLLHGQDVTDLRPEERARLGLGRSFQQARLFEDLTVRQVLQVALEREEPSEFVPSVLGLPTSRAAERRKDLRAAELLDLLGLRPYTEMKASELSTGTRRIVELGCTVALGSGLLLLDEPTGGIAQREVEAFTPVLRRIRDHLDASMVVIAHDVPMMVGLVDRMYVLASGQVIATGPPEILQRDPAVIAAYLGADDDLAPDPVPARPAARKPAGATRS